jgi:predicted NBD/HSP70 family sugar kinase
VPEDNTGRWRGAVAVLDAVRREPGVTRSAMAQRLGLRSGTATELAARLRELALLAESPAAPAGRGRPTTTLAAHPDGPLVLAVDVRHEDWRCAVGQLDGRMEVVAARRHDGSDPGAVLAALRRVILRARRQAGPRLRVVSVAVAGTVRELTLVQAATLGWVDVGLGGLTTGTGLPLLAGNDATLAGVAEARRGPAAGASTLLHLTVEVGIGGTLVAGGRAQTGATGAGGEFGHLPFGDRALRCPCGARGCWDLEVDGRALARHLGEPAPADARSYARRVLERAPGEPRARRALAAVAGALGAGTAGLVNAGDPDVVTLGGLAGPLRDAAPEAFAAAYADGLMAFRRPQPPPVLTAGHGEDGALRGALDAGFDVVVSEAGLAAWAARHAPAAGRAAQ